MNVDIFLITITVFGIAFFGMAIGVVVVDKRIKGSCGGIGALMGKSGCDSCAFKEKCDTTGKEICEEGEETVGECGSASC